MPTLTWEQRDGRRTVFQLSAGEIVIGRDPGNSIRLESEYVSKRHAVIRAGPQGCTIADLGSSNGTSVNGRRITEALLHDGDRVDLGVEVLKFSGEAAAGSIRGGYRRNPVVLAAIGCGGLVILLLVARLMMSGAPPAQPRRDAAPSNTPATTTRPAEPAGPPTVDPIAIDPGLPPSPGGQLAQPAQPPLPAAARPIAGEALPSANSALPANDPVALYDYAMSAVKGGRLPEARRLLIASLKLDARNLSAQQRLREVDATIEATIDRHLADGQRAFTYLRYQDAILEWEQVMGMADPTDPRHQQAATGIQRARERLSR